MTKEIKFTMFENRLKNITYSERSSIVESWLRKKGIQITENMGLDRKITHVLIYEVKIKDSIDYEEFLKELYSLPKLYKFIDIVDCY